MQKKKIVLLWSGGWDGTFRFLQLMQYDILIQPIYIIDSNRKSTEYEIKAMQTIIEKTKGKFTASVLDIQYFRKDWILASCKDEEISMAFKHLRKKYLIGSQYEWFALLCNHTELKMESAVVHQYHGKVEDAIEAEGTLKLIENDFLPNRYCVCSKENMDNIALVFGNLIFPVIKLTKLDEERIARENGWIDIMNLSWFCHSPINGMPCGICGPCDDAMNTGMDWRMPEESKRRYRYRKFYIFGRKCKAHREVILEAMRKNIEKISLTVFRKDIRINYIDREPGRKTIMNTQEPNILQTLLYKTYTNNTPCNAIILAAGFGMRMVPINLSTPKALLEVNGERLIDRLITQLNAVGVKDITVVVGFMKESFKYLIDKYGVELVANEEYGSKNNLHSLSLVADHIHNTYIIPCDIWCNSNPFKTHELCSWYMVSDLMDRESTIKVNEKMELVAVSEHEVGNSMIGISYLSEPEAKIVREKIRKLNADDRYNEDFWEEALYKEDHMILPARIVHSSDVVEINTYEQLRELDGNSSQLKADALDVIAKVFHTTSDNIVNISILKKGMTNRSFLFSVKGDKYIMRIPGEGTDQLINRTEEAEVFRTISGLGLCDDPVYINPENGYKITRFLKGIRVADSNSPDDLKLCMKKLKDFHKLELKVNHTFNIFYQIEFYENLWEGQKSIYADYKTTKENVMSLREYIEEQPKEWSLTHIDAVPDNFLFYTTSDGTEEVQLTDWEYAGMQDPHVDIAMFCIYSLYSKQQIDHLINIYFEGNCDNKIRIKIYAYIAVGGLLWSNWCEYKQKLGIEFGEYSRRQYQYAKDYYRIVQNELQQSC